MKNNGIIQFVGFITSLEPDSFVSSWDQYARAFLNEPRANILQESTATKSRFRYISRHVSEQQDLRFKFIKGRESEHFAGQKVKVVQAGGFMPLQEPVRQRTNGNTNKVIAFLHHNENEIEAYQELAGPHPLHIYQAYYESCLYGHILEFITPANDSTELIAQLNSRPGCEASIYRSCMVPHL